MTSTAPDEVFERQKVVGVEWRGHLKEIRLRPRGSPLLLPRSACVSTGDTVILTPEEIVVPCRNGKARLYPFYLGRETIRIGKLSFDLLIKEITEETSLLPTKR